MSIVPTLISAYKKHGFDIAAGLQPKRCGGSEEAQFTWLTRKGQSVTNGLGISMLEVFVLESLLGIIKPKSIFIIGNSFGWSTLALALMAPKARVVAIDSGLDHQTEQGIKLTQDIAKSLKLNVRVVKATSPQNVPAVVKKHLGGKVDFAFIDGLHTNAQIVLDAKALKPFLAKNASVLFHDVREFGLEPGLADIEKMLGKKAHVLEATTSGMALLPLAPHRELSAALAAYTPAETATNVVKRKAAWDKQMRRTRLPRTLWRSLCKRLGLPLPAKPNFHGAKL
ncbi:MAG TPA: class I SAM-dependent methyltransferase [Alphaproteobacteria bacterium]|nr:class I SAM-dependent methyltransferase [Alphaproteobacteria bacterium]